MVEVVPVERRGPVLAQSRLACLKRIPTINLTAGCAHACRYCYTRGYSSYPGEGKILLYANTLARLQKELPRKRQKPEAVYFSSSSDLFQPVPQVRDLAYDLLAFLLEQGIGVAFLTKGEIPDRHFDLLGAHASRVRGQIGLISLDPEIQKTFEPHAAPPGLRLEQAKRLAQAGIQTRVRLDPVLPGLTDDEESLQSLCAALADAGVKQIAVSALFLRPAIVGSLKRTAENREWSRALLKGFEPAEKMRIQAENSMVLALGVEEREKIYGRIRRIAEGQGIKVKVCACKNPDLATGTCSIAGDWSRLPAQPRALALFEEPEQPSDPLPGDYGPVRPELFEVERIVLAKGSRASAERRRFVENICALYPQAEVDESEDVTHHQVDLGEADALLRHRRGKRTLVFGEHRSAVRLSEEAGNTCPNYWHFSPYSFCFYGCHYCYLAGTPTFWHSPTIRIHLNLGEILREIDRAARKLSRPTAFYLGKLQDGLALDPLTGYSTVLVPFFARHEFARQVILTKSDAVDRLLGLKHGGHTILSWSLNPPEVASRLEENVPAVEERVRAMRRCAEKGYPVRAVIMPIIPVENWEEIYARFLQSLLATVPLQRLTLGGICSYRNAKALMERKLGADNAISSHLEPKAGRSADGRLRYPVSLRVEIYSSLLRLIHSVQPELELALCLEEPAVGKALAREARLGRCNCVL
jgi:DNA repair photolyase